MSPPFVFVRVDYSADGDSLMSSKSSAPNVQSARVALYPGMPVSELLSILLTLFPQIPTNRRILGMEVNGEFIGIRSICTRPEALKSAESVQLVVEAGMFSDDPLSPYPYGFDLSSSTVVNVNSPEIVGDILASAGNKLVVIEFFRKQ